MIVKPCFKNRFILEEFVVSDIDSLKSQAANLAVSLIRDGMVIGLGSGSTAAFAIEAIGKMVSKGLKIKAIPTSQQSRQLAEKNQIQLTSFARDPQIDITIDGADQVENASLNLVKGMGNALLGEKIVARSSKKLVIIVDEHKMVDCLGNKTPLPVEVVPFGWEITAKLIAKYGCTVDLKKNANNEALVTDSGHYILNCHFTKIEHARKLDRELKLITGVVETGLFIGMADLVVVAKQSGVITLQREQREL